MATIVIHRRLRAASAAVHAVLRGEPPLALVLARAPSGDGFAPSPRPDNRPQR